MNSCQATRETRQPGARAKAIVTLSLLLLCAGAQAQSVRKCQIDGRVVFQSSPCPIEAHVASATPAPAAEGSAAPKKKTLADLLRERDGSDRGRPRVREPQSDGANVLRSRMGAV